MNGLDGMVLSGNDAADKSKNNLLPRGVSPLVHTRVAVDTGCARLVCNVAVADVSKDFSMSLS